MNGGVYILTKLEKLGDLIGYAAVIVHIGKNDTLLLMNCLCLESCVILKGLGGK